MKVMRNGQAVEMELVFKFATPENNKKYAVYTDRSKDDKGQLNLYAYYYTDNENDLKPIVVEDTAIVEEALKQLKENYS